MKTIRTLLIYFLIGIAAAWGVRAAVKQSGIINVHSGQSKTLKWNTETHEEVRNETADGNVILTVQPKSE